MIQQRKQVTVLFIHLTGLSAVAEMMGTTEEVEVRKEPRVVGEVELNKETKQRERKVRDAVRSSDVEIEEIESGSRKRK